MKRMPSILITSLLLIVFVSVYVVLPKLNSYQVDGKISLNILEEPVTVHRDEYGIPYVFANNTADVIRAQGFVIAQDRIFQIEMYRAIIEGRLASIIGESGLNSDIQMLVIGIGKNARRHLKFLDDESKDFLAWYAQGYNAFVEQRKKEYPIELKLLGITPKKVDAADLLAFQHFAGFIQGRNYEDEILSLNLAAELGVEKAKSLAPLNINPDRSIPALPNTADDSPLLDGSIADLGLQTLGPPPVALPASGSNNWVTGSSKSSNGVPILVNDPHLDASILPGPWYPIGLFTPNLHAIGANLPGVPGLLLGRNRNVSFGVTNAYGDSQDLYVERIDPSNKRNYVEGDRSFPFKLVKRLIEVKDESEDNGKRQQELLIRYTRRGPVISDHAVFGVQTEQPVVLRMASAEVTSGSLGITQTLFAKTVEEFDAAATKIDLFFMNYVFADKDGGIGHRTTGLIPLRQNGERAKLSAASDDWMGFIPKDEMPGQINPSRDWLGTSNHDVIPDNYPYYYSTHFSPNYRYLRTSELLSGSKAKSADDHWEMLKDVKNKHAQRLTPVFLAAIENHEDLAAMHRELSTWDFEDQVDSVAATMFHLTHEYLIRLMFEDDLSADLLIKVLKSRYYWLQRTDEMIMSGNSEWFDIQGTEKQETVEDLIVMAAERTISRLHKTLGSDTSQWRWGPFHKVKFVSPLRQNGFGQQLLGGGSHEVSGSGETLNRGQYSLNEGPYQSQWFSSLRMVADMSDNEKIMGSMSGGNSSRQFHPYFKSQLNGWIKQDWIPWWLDKSKIEQNSEAMIQLFPTQQQRE